MNRPDEGCDGPCRSSRWISSTRPPTTAAGDTTRNVVAGGMEALFEHPDQRKILFKGDNAVIASGVEEMLRWVSPITNQRRTVTADTEVGGKHIAQGQKIVSFYGIANRDPVKFSDPWTFDVLRSPSPHLAFGFGTHFCVGTWPGWS